MRASNVYGVAEPPTLILSSNAAGDRAAGAAIAERLGRASHYAIEDLIGPTLRAADFVSPVAPLGWRYKLWHARRLPEVSQLDVLAALIRRSAVKTVIATSHRAAFWVAELKRRGYVHCAVWAVATDFHVGRAWRWLPWQAVDRFLGPLPAAALPAGEQRIRYRRVVLPVGRAFAALAETPGDRRHVLVSAGARGIAVTEELVQARADTTVHLSCGEDGDLYQRAFTRFCGHRRVRVYAFEPSLWPLMAIAGAVVVRAGALTLAEAAAAGRPMFVLPARGARERANAEWAARLWGAVGFSVEAVTGWQLGRRQLAGPRARAALAAAIVP